MSFFIMNVVSFSWNFLSFHRVLFQVMKEILTTELEVSSANMFDILMIFKSFSGAPNCLIPSTTVVDVPELYFDLGFDKLELGAAYEVFNLLGATTFLLSIELVTLPETKTKKRAKTTS